MPAPTHEALYDLPPSAKLVYKLLEWEGPLTQQQLRARSLLSARTVRFALAQLDEIDAIEEDIYFPDARQSIYRLVRETASGSASPPSRQV